LADGFPNRPKIVRGAFVEYGLSIPPLFVVFQFNPLQLSRNRSVSYSAPNSVVATPPEGETEPARRARTTRQQTSLRDFHQREFAGEDNLIAIRDGQQVRVQEESISFDIRLDATGDLEQGDAIAAGFGIAPRLATLELMVYPKAESLLGAALGSLLGSSGGFSFTRAPNPPMILFIWGIKRVLPVNINSLNITETEFSPTLDPIRATVAVNLTVIEGPNLPYTYSKALKEVSSALNLANISDIANVVIPG
jgi:hypothetical protein